MPTYEYECQRCKHVFERFQSMTDTPLQRCPKCRGKVRRMIGSGAGLLFKGSGFYITDYRNESYHKARKAEQSDAGSDKGSSGKKKDSGAGKPEKKKTQKKTTSSKAE